MPFILVEGWGWGEGGGREVREATRCTYLPNSSFGFFFLTYKNNARRRPSGSLLTKDSVLIFSRLSPEINFVLLPVMYFCVWKDSILGSKPFGRRLVKGTLMLFVATLPRKEQPRDGGTFHLTPTPVIRNLFLGSNLFVQKSPGARAEKQSLGQLGGTELPVSASS